MRISIDGSSSLEFIENPWPCSLAVQIPNFIVERFHPVCASIERFFDSLSARAQIEAIASRLDFSSSVLRRDKDDDVHYDRDIHYRVASLTFLFSILHSHCSTLPPSRLENSGRRKWSERAIDFEIANDARATSFIR